MSFLGIRLPTRRLWILVAALVLGSILGAPPFLTGPRSAFADATSTSFTQTSVQLPNVGSQATITVATVGVDAGADGFTINIQHTSAVTVTTPACVGIFTGANATGPTATTGGTLLNCQFFTAGQNVSATTGNIMTFVLTRAAAAGNPLITMLTTGIFRTEFINNAVALGAGQTNTLQVLGGTAAPAVTTVTANSGPTAGGTVVAITGTGFLTGAAVTFGGTAATNVTVVNSTTITATTPAKAAGAVNVVVTNSDSQSGTLTGGFTFTDAIVTGAIPSVSEWGLIALAVLIAGGLIAMRRRRPQAA